MPDFLNAFESTVATEVSKQAIAALRNFLSHWSVDVSSTQERFESAIEQHQREVKSWSEEISFKDLLKPKATSEIFVPLNIYLLPRKQRISAEEQLISAPLSSATVLANIRSRRSITNTKTWSMDFVGVAPVEFRSLKALPHTLSEVRGISELFSKDRRKVYLYDEASKKALQSEELKQYRYVHFATHGTVDSDRPQFCGLALRDAEGDALLNAFEVFRLELDSELVTLSACSTGLGRETRGEGMVGLMRAFFCAGTSSVCASLWNVADASTSLMMRRFYTYLAEQRRSRSVDKAEALRKAKLDMLDDVRWAHPYYWASFILAGDWQ